MSESLERLSRIYNFREIGEHLGTSGQPTETQFQDIRDAGYEAVINLALPTSDKAIAQEGSIVSKLGMAYVHIPVNFQNPTDQDFDSFCGVMTAFKERRVFVHCAANMRVSAFVFLYRVLELGVPQTEAERDLKAIWDPDPCWDAFLRRQLAEHRSGH
jgi:protein tyrosine phosphatase (PTP) superfamily phosphohydrolase (DUF442 family)